MSSYKAERRVAEGRSVGQPYAAYVRGREGRTELHPLCTRAIYKKLKRARQAR